MQTEALEAPVGQGTLPAARMLKVGGFTPFTATDYPGKLAAVVFVQGCPWRCGYCHNPHLQSRTEDSPLDWAAVLARLARRVGLIDAVVFSGGEPTMDPGLEAALRAVRALGLGVGLHTAGMYPRRLQEVLPLVDWVGLDIKANHGGYDTVTGVADSAQAVWESIRQVLDSGVAYECRTTLHPQLHGEADILALAGVLQAMGVRHYALQVFRSTGCVDPQLQASGTLGYPSDNCLAQVSARFSQFSLRRA